MKRTVLVLIFLALGFGMAQESAEAVLDKVLNSQRGGQSNSSVITMEVVRPDKTTPYQIRSVSDGDARSLTQVIAPSKEAGQAFLQDGDNLYLYNPRLKRVLRLPPSNQNDSFLGSDLSYSDLGGDDLTENYTAEVSAQEAGTVELTLTPDPLAPTPYGKVVLVADAANGYRPVTYTYYDQRGNPVRELSFSNYVEVDDVDFPSHLEIKNLTAEGEKTVIDFQDLKFGVTVNQACFEQSALERGCS